MLVSQQAITPSSGTGGNQWKKKNEYKKAAVNAAPAAVPAVAPPVQQQQQHAQQGRPLRPCKMAGQGCKGSHPLGQCEVFKKMTPERRLAKLQEVGLCLYCFKHSKDAEFYAENHPSYKGCEENGCGGHHHRSLHWKVAVGCLLQINAQPESYEPGAQVFTLRQNLKVGGVSCNIAFDGGSDRTMVTEKYAKEKVLWKLDKRAAVMGFGEATPTCTDVYEVSITDRAGKQHLLQAAAVPWIQTGPAARCPQDLRYRFLRIYNPLAEEMHQTGEDTDVCL
jgi:hypothetical protein